MTNPASLLMQLVGFAFTLAALLGLSRWISRQVQVVGLRLTRSDRAALLAYFLLLLPGIALHELSHAALARILGLRVSKFSLWPRARGRYVELGSVQITSGGPLRDSLVGLAPFLAGTAVLTFIGWRIFDVPALARAWDTAGWPALLGLMPALWRVPDLWLWAYLIFAVSNAMTPSPADRQPWLVAGLYLGLATSLAWLLGGLPSLAAAFAGRVSGTLHLLTLAFLFTLALDILAGALLLLIEALLIQVHGPALPRARRRK